MTIDVSGLHYYDPSWIQPTQAGYSERRLGLPNTSRSKLPVGRYCAPLLRIPLGMVRNSAPYTYISISRGRAFAATEPASSAQAGHRASPGFSRAGCPPAADKSRAAVRTENYS